MRRVEGQVPGCRLPQVDQEGGVHHGDCKAAPAVPLADGDVGRRALVVALQEVEAEFCVGVPKGQAGDQNKGRPRTPGRVRPGVSFWLQWPFPSAELWAGPSSLQPPNLSRWAVAANTGKQSLTDPDQYF